MDVQAKYQAALKKYRHDIQSMLDTYSSKSLYLNASSQYSYWNVKQAFDAIAIKYGVELDAERAGTASDGVRAYTSWEMFHTPEYAVIFVSGGWLYILANDEPTRRRLLREFKWQGLILRKEPIQNMVVKK